MIKINLYPVTDKTDLISLFKQHPLFANFPDGLYDVVTQEAKYVNVVAGDILFNEGDAAEQYMLVAEGEIEMFRYSIEGDERVFNIFGKGQLIAHAAMFMQHGKYPMNARARNDAYLYCLNRQSLHQACYDYPELAIRLLSGLSVNVYQQLNQVHWLTSSSAQERLAHYFVELNKKQGNQQKVSIPVTQRQLAAQLGIRAETLNRLLGEWQQKNYIEGKRKDWVLLDLAYLQELSGAAKRTF
ncbi:cyclic nucleotide-binding protein [Pelistega indica]|uniref:Cyclic nucleotide-binding protein n=1 Tax=Pelistega indica TaxID=1414851 RepID=V8G2V0_9BURK|nr:MULTISPECIES: Crp/Fnr family transcriptional regulator [Pelistega]ETD70416.1 cyclic nucleotide-binding protein [Pelistega indica]